MKRTKIKDREIPNYTKGEEIFNMVSHITGGAIAVASLIICVIVAAGHGNTWGIATGVVYGLTMVILYTMSSVYHGLIKKSTSKKVMQILDHCAIYLLIAGTYTPILLNGLRQAYPVLAWCLFGIVWASAILGVTFNAIDLKKYRVFSMICYLCSGWLIMIAAKQLIEVASVSALILLLAGGVAYTVGSILYGLGRKLRYMHSVFHLFVIAGSVLHFFCIVLYIL